MPAYRATWLMEVPGTRRRALGTYTLTVKAGPSKGRRLEVTSPVVVLGALEGVALRLEDPSVSGLHAELSHDSTGIRVRDLGSRNGTCIDGVQVRDAVLTGPAVLRLGASEVAFEPGQTVVELPASPSERFGAMVGATSAMRELFLQLEQYAPSDSTVLIRGETGTGKELVAEALVQGSPRANGPLVVVDCSALAPSLVEGELFGHEKGAFTGATMARPGAFERAHGGTVFLDELGELPLELQPRLLRVLERREVQRLGAARPIPVDVRVLAATHRPLEEEVNRGSFRADLYYRLSVLHVRVPALRERLEDLPLLTRHLAGQPLDERTLARFARHDWPGNVRELRNAVERWKVGADPLGTGGELHLASREPDASASGASLDAPFLQQKEQLVMAFERQYARLLLERAGGNLSEAARVAGLSRMAVVKLLGRHSLLT